MITILSFPANNRNNININDNNTSNSMFLKLAVDFNDNFDLFERYVDLFE